MQFGRISLQNLKVLSPPSHQRKARIANSWVWLKFQSHDALRSCNSWKCWPTLEKVERGKGVVLGTFFLSSTTLYHNQEFLERGYQDCYSEKVFWFPKVEIIPSESLCFFTNKKHSVITHKMFIRRLLKSCFIKDRPSSATSTPLVRASTSI